MTTEEFLAIAKERYGSRGARQAKEMLEELDRSTRQNLQLSESEIPAHRSLMMEMWLDSKEEAKKYTPKKYREEGKEERLAAVDFQTMLAENEFH